MESEKIDFCKTCIRKAEFNDVPCTECGDGMMEVRLESLEMHMTCKKCGAKVLGVSFYAPCETDKTKFYVTVKSDTLSNNQIMNISKFTYIPVLRLKQMLQSERKLDKGFYLYEITGFMEKLDSMNIEYEITPPICYGDYKNCDKRDFVRYYGEF